MRSDTRSKGKNLSYSPLHDRQRDVGSEEERRLLWLDAETVDLVVIFNMIVQASLLI